MSCHFLYNCMLQWWFHGEEWGEDNMSPQFIAKVKFPIFQKCRGVQFWPTPNFLHPSAATDMHCRFLNI